MAASPVYSTNSRTIKDQRGRQHHRGTSSKTNEADTRETTAEIAAPRRAPDLRADHHRSTRLAGTRRREIAPRRSRARAQGLRAIRRLAAESAGVAGNARRNDLDVHSAPYPGAAR